MGNVKANVTLPSTKKINMKCLQCAGRCWDSDQSKRQANARAFFKGAIPNDCVDSEVDGPLCPYRK